MTFRRATGSIAALHNIQRLPQIAPWPMCRQCMQPLDEIGLEDDPEICPGRNKLQVKVFGKHHGETEVVTIDLLSNETLAQDPAAVQKAAARWPFFRPDSGHMGK